MKKHKLHSILVVAVIMAASAVSGGPLFIPKASAASPSYNYVINNGNCLPYVPTAQCVADISIVSGDATQQIYGGGVFNYKDGSTYDFTSGGGAIHVTYSDPSHGVLTPTQGSKQTITIGSPGNFTGYFVNGQAPESTTTAIINVNLAVNFGAQDPSLEVGKVDLSVKAGASVAPSTKSTDPNPTTLTSSTVNYSSSFSPEGAGSYSVCATADFIIAANNQVCKNVTKTAGKPLSVSLSANGDPSKFQASKGATSVGCESQGGPLSWIMCPVIKGLSEAIDSIYSNMIQPLLKTQPLNLSANDPTRTYQIWSNFRIFGDVFLIVALLVVVFGESLGGGLIDAYAAKKILPRLLVAAIAINLSIYIVALAVDVTNILGNGIADLILQPFSSIPKGLNLQMGWMSSGLLLGGLVGGAIWAGSLGAALLEFLFAFLLLPAFLLFLAIMATVILRRALIIILVILAPVAFALYCLPNTEKYFKKWWETLFKTLLIYPLIAILFAVSKVVAFTLESGTQGQGVTPAFAQLMGTIALFVPLFLIPFSFKLAGGILGQVHDVMHGASKRAHQAALGNANDPSSWRNRARRRLMARNADLNLSQQGLGATFNPRNVFNPSARRAGRRSARNMWQAHYGAQGMGMRQYEQYKDDSNVMGDLALHGSTQASRAAIEKDIQAGKFKRDSPEHQRRLFASTAADQIGRDDFMRRQALMNPVTAGYAIDVGEKGWDQAMDVAHELAGFSRKADGSWDEASGDHGTYAALQNQFQAVAKGPAGRADLSGAVDGGHYDGDRAYAQHSLYEMGNAKAKEVEGFGQHFTSQFINGGSAGKHKAAVFYHELEATKQAAKGGTRDEIIKQMKALENLGINDYMEQTTMVTGADGVTVPMKNRERARREARVFDREELRRRQEAGEA